MPFNLQTRVSSNTKKIQKINGMFPLLTVEICVEMKHSRIVVVLLMTHFHHIVSSCRVTNS